jgi:hypothetical protein
MRSRAGYAQRLSRLGGWVVPGRSPKPSWRSSTIRSSRRRRSRWTAGCTHHVSAIAEQGSLVNVSINYEPMKRRGFSPYAPYGPLKAALEPESIVYAQDLEGTGV